jgi:hypothetical protein
MITSQDRNWKSEPGGRQLYKGHKISEDDQIFETGFENKRDKAVHISEYDRLLVVVEPGETRHVESRNAMTTYAPWSRLVFSGKDKIHFTENKQWKFPFPDMLMLEVVNTDGALSESLRFGNKFYSLYRHIPRFIPVSYDDMVWCFVARLEKKLVGKKIKEGDYFIKKTVAEYVKTLRSKKEIASIEQKLFAKKADKQKADMEKYEQEIKSKQGE